MKKLLRSLGPAAAILALAAAPVSAQFDHYVALGDSLTAGVEGGCLVERNQEASFPRRPTRSVPSGPRRRCT